MEDYIKMSLGSSFLLNAGILGLIRFLIFNNAKPNDDYKIEGQNLYVKKDYILNNDIPNMYVHTVGQLLKRDSYLLSLLDKRDYILKLYEENPISKENEKIISDYYKILTKKLASNSINAGFNIVYKTNPEIDLGKLEITEKIKKGKSGEESTITITPKIVAALNKEKDIYKQKELYLKLVDILSNQRIQDVLLFKECMYSKLNIFMGDSSFFNRTATMTPIEDCFKKDYYDPLIAEITTTKAKNKRCIECYNLSNSTVAISFMQDTTDDVNRKKSAYWNCKPDAFVCPVCAFTYMFVPLGFSYFGQDAVFINNNSSIDAMIGLMTTYDEQNEDENQANNRSRIYKPFISEKITALENKINNIQVIIRRRYTDKDKEKKRYEFNVIGKDKVEKLKKSKTKLVHIEKITIKNADKYIKVYDETMNNIVYNMSQYSSIYKLIKLSLSNNSNINYIKNILDIEIIFKGGNNMEDLKKYVDRAFMSGVDMRNKLTENIQEKDVDNNLRGFVYKLTNAASVNNRDLYLDSIMRVYSGKGIPIPPVFKEMYQSDEMFKAIATGYILGLKYSKYEKAEANKEDN